MILFYGKLINSMHFRENSSLHFIENRFKNISFNFVDEIKIVIDVFISLVNEFSQINCFD